MHWNFLTYSRRYMTRHMLLSLCFMVVSLVYCTIHHYIPTKDIGVSLMSMIPTHWKWWKFLSRQLQAYWTTLKQVSTLHTICVFEFRIKVYVLNLNLSSCGSFIANAALCLVQMYVLEWCIMSHCVIYMYKLKLSWMSPPPLIYVALHHICVAWCETMANMRQIDNMREISMLWFDVKLDKCGVS